VADSARGGVSRPAHAKVNLWLNVVGRRADGYHLLNSLVVFADLADTICAAAADELTLDIDAASRAPGATALGAEPDNLVLKAARRLAERAGMAPRAALRLVKNIPVAAGLGGGSADAAATLRALVALWRLALSEDELFDIARGLGADVPMCLAGRASIATGIGEKLEAAPALPPCAILLVNPGVAVATPAVFAARRGGFTVELPAPRAWTDLASLVEALAMRGNDLAPPAIALQPVIGDVLDRLRLTTGARYVAMSGSGASCFALYETKHEADSAASGLPAAWWRHAGVLA
jgi:4-diphosphocytidyl-2-C-methyl-D-erythritol kinase